VTETLDERYRRLHARQLEMNAHTWRVLQSRGVTDHSELRLDFTYAASTQEAANRLRKVLVDQTDYAVVVEQSPNRPGWRVTGSTQPTSISPTILEQWVDWMITAGLHQDCDFDGWGCEVPV
jgi:hypothetical protein